MLVLRAPDAVGQTAGGALTGVVRDASGASVPGASVTIIEVSTNRSRRVVSNSAGIYTLSGLAPGEYRVAVLAPGFRPLSRQAIRVATGQTIRLDLDLAVGNLSETVTVAADVPLLRQETAGLGQVVEHERIVDLPLNGRSFVSLAVLAPRGRSRSFRSLMRFRNSRSKATARRPNAADSTAAW
jgi:hypothetical protein